MDTDQLMELAPHYIAMFILVFLVLAVVQVVAGEIGFWPEIATIALVVLAYRLIVVRLGIGPSGWE
jgi:membrane protein YdbS with pleckstrin-like domain